MSLRVDVSSTRFGTVAKVGPEPLVIAIPKGGSLRIEGSIFCQGQLSGAVAEVVDDRGVATRVHLLDLDGAKLS